MRSTRTLVAAVVMASALVASPVGPSVADPVVSTSIGVGFLPVGVAMTPNGSRTYVTNQLSDTVSVIDTASNTVIKTVSLPASSVPEGVAVSGDGAWVYVANSQAGTVSVISTATNAVTSTISGVTGAFRLALIPDGSRLYVSSNMTDSVFVIDTATQNILTVINSAPEISDPGALAMSPDGSRLYVANNLNVGSLAVIDTATNVVIANPGPFQWPSSIAVSPDGSRAYVSSGPGGSVAVMNTSTNAVLTTITGLTQPGGVAVSPDGRWVYALNAATGTLSVIDAATNTLGSPVTGLNSPHSIAVMPDGTRAYVANGQFSGTVSVVLLRPSAPTAVAASAADGQAGVSWNAPSFTGGQPISGYTATASPGGRTCTSATTSCTITGLTNGTAYTIRVTATNSIGTSIPSAASAAVTPVAAFSPPPPGPTTTPSTPPTRLPQKPRDAAGTPPKSIKKSGITVLTGRNALTDAGQAITTAVTVKTPVKKRAYRVIRGSQGQVSLRTFGRAKLRVTLVQTASGTDGYLPYELRTVYRVKR